MFCCPLPCQYSWDLAHATGRLAELDPDLAAQALEAFPKFAPPEARSEQGPFSPVLPVPDDADVYTRLAACTAAEGAVTTPPKKASIN
ncbi:hypothetical protein [Streptomyces sp. I05A-00742]|uniref:hypothetical protein n=1 Tax=Streptomyces sp. I05A-00742 TaxID=2732853 RepID=UPI001BB13186|nr:hypothetical protein [Streptomyces sp. I05A-00742]